MVCQGLPLWLHNSIDWTDKQEEAASGYVSELILGRNLHMGFRRPAPRLHLD
ncbi:hypothetical protein NMD1_02340 [Novosphingobium sp. MD-1]|nr:hypothetical protein NMD1_02340 [Novosphingobium sp. MD-1]